MKRDWNAVELGNPKADSSGQEVTNVRISSELTATTRVEKYRPSTLSDVAGHKDVLATINKFVSSNVRLCLPLVLSTSTES